MKKIPIAEHLTDEEYSLLLNVYANHSRFMKLDDRKNQTLSDIVKIVRISGGKSLMVYYKNGDSWRYSEDGTWSQS